MPIALSHTETHDVLFYIILANVPTEGLTRLNKTFFFAEWSIIVNSLMMNGREAYFLAPHFREFFPVFAPPLQQ